MGPRIHPQENSPLNPGEFHIHLLKLNTPLSQIPVKDLLSFLPVDERKRYQQLMGEPGRAEFLWSRLFLRRLLAFYSGMEMKDLKLNHGDHGKPFLEHSPLRFNVSHTQDLIACSLGFHDQGVDIEKVDPSPKARERTQLLADRFFSREEQDYWRAASPEKKDLVFLQLFTRKEAYVKALGRGLSLPWTSFSVPLTFSGSSRSGGWKWWTSRVEPADYCLSHVAEDPKDAPYRYEVIHWDEKKLWGAWKNSGPTAPVLVNAVA